MSSSPTVDAIEVPARRRRRQMRLVREVPAPVLRWAGGKTKLLDDLVARAPRKYARYFEPFAGGAALFFRLRPERAVVSDSCPELVEFYAEVSRDPGAVFAELRQLTSGDPLASYYPTRLAWNQERMWWSGTQRAATFLYLNKTCYNGLWRVNRRGAFNVPVGKFSSGPSYPVLADLVAAGDALRRVEVRCGDYAAMFDRAISGDFVYADPPYVPRSKTAQFSSYSVDGFDEDAQRLLARRVHELVARGVQVMVSQADVPLVREIYAGLDFHEVSAPRSVNSSSDKRGPVPELIMTGGFS